MYEGVSPAVELGQPVAERDEAGQLEPVTHPRRGGGFAHRRGERSLACPGQSEPRPGAAVQLGEGLDGQERVLLLRYAPDGEEANLAGPLAPLGLGREVRDVELGDAEVEDVRRGAP